MLMTNVLKPQQAQPRDLSNRLLQRLYPGDYAAPAPPKSPTGLPISTPPPPQYPTMPQRTAPNAALSRSGMAQGAMGTQSAAPVAPQATPTPSYVPHPTTQGNPMQMIGGYGQRNAAPDPFGDLDPEHRKALDEYFNSLAGIDYKGSHESALMQRAALAQLMRGWEMEGPIDYTSAAPMADQFSHSRNQLSADLAARGINGGVVGGALSNSYAQEARGIGDYIRQLVQERQQQHHSDYQNFLNWTRGLNAMGLQQNINQQNSGGFWDTLAGVGGSLLGGLIP